jgi:AbrB family looped-hinge helix DNA binding protein
MFSLSLTNVFPMGTLLAVITTVTGKNQITIPAELARDANIRPGTRLEWSQIDQQSVLVRIVPNRADLAQQLVGRGRKYLRPGTDPIRDLIQERVQDDRES